MANYTNSAKVVWMVSISCLVSLHNLPMGALMDAMFPDKDNRKYLEPLTSVLLVSVNITSVSFALDRICNKVERKSMYRELIMLTGYCFYFPLFVCGPFVSSKIYKESLSRPQQILDRTFWTHTILHVLKYGLWFTVTDVSLYFIYQQAFSYDPSSVALWTFGPS